MKKLLLIVNPASGARRGRRFLPDMISLFSRGGYLVTVCLTEKRGDAADFARQFAGEADLAVACGGDGTLNEVVAGLLSAGLETPIGYIPAGSTNDFAATLALPLQIPKACAAILSREPRPLDVGRFGSDRYFTYTASFGAFTSVSYATPQNMKNLLGHTAYILQGIASLKDIRPVHMKITTGGRDYENDYIFGAVCNSTSLGGVLKLEDEGIHMNDGLFEALLIPYPGSLVRLNQIIAALTAHRYDDPSLIFIRASAFTCEGAPDLSWTLDGEEAEGASSLEIRNLPGAIRLIC